MVGLFVLDKSQPEKQGRKLLRTRRTRRTGRTTRKPMACLKMPEILPRRHRRSRTPLRHPRQVRPVGLV